MKLTSYKSYQRNFNTGELSEIDNGLIPEHIIKYTIDGPEWIDINDNRMRMSPSGEYLFIRQGNNYKRIDN